MTTLNYMSKLVDIEQGHTKMKIGDKEKHDHVNMLKMSNDQTYQTLGEASLMEHVNIVQA